MADIAPESAAELNVEATKEVCSESAPEVVQHTDAEATVETKTTETCAAEAGDSTGEPESTGVKRKSEDDENEVKKVKTDSCHGEVETCPADEQTVSNGDENGKGEEHVEGSEENGKAAGDVPQEIVTKSVDEAVNQAEDIAASS